MYVNKVDNLEEMTKFLETYNIPRLKQERTENLNILITSNEIKSIIKNSQQTKVQDQTASQGKGVLGRSKRVAWTYIHYQT